MQMISLKVESKIGGRAPFASSAAGFFSVPSSFLPFPSFCVTLCPSACNGPFFSLKEAGESSGAVDNVSTACEPRRNRFNIAMAGFE